MDKHCIESVSQLRIILLRVEGFLFVLVGSIRFLESRLTSVLERGRGGRGLPILRGDEAKSHAKQHILFQVILALLLDFFHLLVDLALFLLQGGQNLQILELLVLLRNLFHLLAPLVFVLFVEVAYHFLFTHFVV